MEKGLLWLPLLAVFIWLTWAGWNEYRKIEGYRGWAKTFQRSKYDIYSVLDKNCDDLTWGTPTRLGPVNLETFSLRQVQEIRALVDRQPIDPAHPPNQGRQIALEFTLVQPLRTISIPFTEIPLAVEWLQQLQQDLRRIRLVHNIKAEDESHESQGA